ncbi:MAG TPA: acyl-CoA desaturase [Polyangiaceae bacterium]|nr:acyl-CoA desaturase [Polyangiaceae bacterium]
MTQPATPGPVEARPHHSADQIFNFVGIVLIHAGTLFALWRGASWRLVALAAATYALRMFAITGVYHRYFSHRTYKTSRPLQFVLALLGTSATQKGPLWWASTHRLHHKHSDTERDVHSPVRRGFWYSHMGWWLGDEHVESRFDQIGDFARFPELRWLDRFHVVGVVLLMGASWLAGGFDGFLWGYVVSTCALLHATFTINSLAHVFGSRRFATSDASRNNALLALITFGEGWHNNHHHYQSSCRQGFYWWEVDLSYYAIKALERVGLVWDVREPPERVLAEGRRPRTAAPAPADGSTADAALARRA